MSGPTIKPSPILQVPGQGYVAGACNIGPWEIRRRRLGALAGFGTALALLALLVGLGAPAWARLVVLLPAWGGAVSWLQARRRFCVAYGVAGLSNFTDDEGGRTHVVDEAQRDLDRQASLGLLRDGLLLAIVPVLVVVLLPI